MSLPHFSPRRWSRALLALLFAATTGAALASHHNDSDASKADPRLNVTDMYVFPSADGRSTVFVMNVGKDAGRDGPRALHPDGLYDFNIDLDGDLVEDVRLRFRVQPVAADGTQAWSVTRLDGVGARTVATPLGGAARFGSAANLGGGGRAWAGLAGDAFAANAQGYFKVVGSALAGKGDFGVFEKPVNFFAEMDVISLVVEVPNASLARPDLAVWATSSVERAGETVQVNRWGNVLVAFLFANNDADAAAMNRSRPADDIALHRARAASRVAALVRGAGTAADPQAYGEAVAARLVPMVQRYRVGTAALYGFGAGNGRALSDDSFDVIMSTAFNRPVDDGVVPGQMRADFPYVPPSRRELPWVNAR